jgi:RNA polymerase sigma-70 factor (sigma-E family)
MMQEMGEEPSPAPAADPLRELFEEQYEPMVRLATALLGDRHVAEDVVQDAFIRIDRKLDGVAPTARPAYLRRAVMNISRSELRRGSRAKRRPRAVRELTDDVESSAVSRSERDRVLDAIDALPVRQRECIVLQHYEGLTVTEMSAAIGISPGAVKTHLDRARRALREQLGGLR